MTFPVELGGRGRWMLYHNCHLRDPFIRVLSRVLRQTQEYCQHFQYNGYTTIFTATPTNIPNNNDNNNTKK